MRTISANSLYVLLPLFLSACPRTFPTQPMAELLHEAAGESIKPPGSSTTLTRPTPRTPPCHFPHPFQQRRTLDLLSEAKRSAAAFNGDECAGALLPSNGRLPTQIHIHIQTCTHVHIHTLSGTQLDSTRRLRTVPKPSGQNK